MTDQQPEARRRMVAGAADMIRRRGLAATSVRDLARHAHAPLGSTYHYFPGGKQQLAAEAVRFAGGTVSPVLAAWEAQLADALRRHGTADAEAARLATLTVAAVEGSVALCRARRDIRPLDDVAASLESLLGAAVTR
jgi:AcrR family transcriptional regulator